MSCFKNLLNEVEANDLKILPILHTTRVYNLLQILENKEISIKDCPVFKQKYLYAFYGIPSYRVKSEGAKRHNENLPVCFILDNTFLPNINKLHPFDSGAFVNLPQIKHDFFNEEMEISEFELEPKIDVAVKCVKKFYTTNFNYLEEKPSVNLDDFNPSDFHVRGYSSLISNNAKRKYDSRVSTIELIFNEKINLNKHSLKQIILPNSFRDDPRVKELLETEYEIINPIGYHTFTGNSSEFYGTIYNKYRDFLDEHQLA